MSIISDKTFDNSTLPTRNQAIKTAMAMYQTKFDACTKSGNLEKADYWLKRLVTLSDKVEG